MDAEVFWRSVLAQDEAAIRPYFQDDAVIRWHCTNERFTVDEYLRANCEYPGKWGGVIERVHRDGSLIVTAVRVFSADASFHAVSFFRIRDGKIAELDEYWGDDGAPPQWRQDKHIGTAIK